MQKPAPTELHGLELNKNTWTPLRLFSLYRLVLSGLFVLLLQTDNLASPLGGHDPGLFEGTAYLYLIFALLARLAVHWRWPAFYVQVYIQVLVDIAAMTLLMHASGGLGSGLGMLLVVSIAGGSMLTAGRTAGFFAAVATIAVLVEQVYSHLHGLFANFHYPQAGMLGATFFATAVLSHVLARRIRESEALAEQRGVDLANMAQLTEFALQQLDTGVVAVDNRERIRLMNTAARRLLDITPDKKPESLEGLSTELARRLRDWHIAEPDRRVIRTDNGELIPRFLRIGTGEPAGTLILLEDASAASRQAQQLKLAALGRLTASIAHEIRNPLGAITHATELLAESDRLDNGERRMTEIIIEQARRVNTIIENVLNLGRRDRSRPESIPMGEWLPQFLEELRTGTGEAPEAIALDLEADDLYVTFDPGHLHQILWNLGVNALRHADGAPNPKVRLHLRAGAAPYVEVADRGPGIDEECRHRLFEPFYTTEAGGTGLGLYIARELAECNRARLDLVSGEGGARFRLHFADWKQRQVA